ncbi:MAG: LuxR C-terminal-related transcriptional regulator [Gaiellaceae bacterium]
MSAPRARLDPRPQTTIRVVLGEDSYLASEGIARVLERAGDLELVATCGDLDTLEKAVAGLTPDVVLTDVRMPPTHTDEGIRFATQLHESDPGIGVVVLTQHTDPAYAMALLGEGSERRAYVLKERVTSGRTLEEVVRAVAHGGSYVDPAVVEALFKATRSREQAHLDELTPRELEILALIAEGRSNSAIATELVLTKRAVERHINNLFMKLELGEAEDVSRRVKAALIYLSGNTG